MQLLQDAARLYAFGQAEVEQQTGDFQRLLLCGAAVEHAFAQLQQGAARGGDGGFTVGAGVGRNGLRRLFGFDKVVRLCADGLAADVVFEIGRVAQFA